MKIPYKWRRRWQQWRQRLQTLKRQLNYYIFDFDSRVYEVNIAASPYLKGFSILLSLLAVISVLLPLGFELSPRIQRLNQYIELGIMTAFAIQYMIRFIMTPNRLEFMKFRWMETTATVFAVFFLGQILTDMLFGVADQIYFLGWTLTFHTATVIVQAYLIFFILVKSLQSLPGLLARQENTSQFLLVSFLGIIGVGTILLMLPKATVDPGGLPFIDALFTSTSAICVTGLIVVDTATKFTLLGQIIILILIQVGGLGIITFATFLALFISRGFTVGQRNVLRSIIDEQNVSVISRTLIRIVGLTFFIEALGTAAFYFSWNSGMFAGPGERFLFSIFHAVSAFCNAGFSLFSNSLADPVNAMNIPVNITTMLLIILGGLGFPTIWELYFRSRGQKPRISIQTKVILIMTVLLITSGGVLIYGLEQNNLLKDTPFSSDIWYALFQSITTRTAGFNTMNIGALSVPATIVMMLLMFIGGSPASTAGGIKTTTAYMLLASVANTVRGKSRLEIGHRTIPEPVLRRALTSVTLAFTTLAIGTLLLSVVEEAPLIDLLFEEISAFATVGLSRGITFDLSRMGKLIVIISMFIGRVGSLTLAASFVTKRDNRKYRYPEESIMVS